MKRVDITEHSIGQEREGFIIHSNNYGDLAKTFGKEHVRIRDESSYVVWTSRSGLMSFARENPSLVHSYEALTLATKVHESLHQHILNQTLNNEDLQQVTQLQLHVTFAFLNLKERTRYLYSVALSIPEMSSEISFQRSFNLTKYANITHLEKKLELLIVIKVNRHRLPIVLKFLLSSKEVLWIEHRDPIHILNRWAKGVVESGSDGSALLSNSGLDGYGQVVGISDTGIDPNNCFFQDPNIQFPYGKTTTNHRKLVLYYPYVDSTDDLWGHGTHVSGSIAGESHSLNKDFDGIVPSAKIAFFDIGNSTDGHLSVPDNLASAMFYPMYLAGARVFSNSWGSYGSNANRYTSDSRSVDIFMSTYPDSLILFAAGNSGADGPHSVVAPSTSKNCISVGASLNDFHSFYSVNDVPYAAATSKITPFYDTPLMSVDKVAWFSVITYHITHANTSITLPSHDYQSQGPTSDGRLKPDCLGPGWSVTSAASGTSCGLRKYRGTSMATPIVAGAAVAIREYFMRGFYPRGYASSSDAFIPSGALLKAMLVHSGQDISYSLSNNGATTPIGPAPSNTVGYGRVELGKVLNFGQSSSTKITLFVIGAAFKQYKTTKNYYVYNDTTFDYGSYSDTQSQDAPLYVSLEKTGASYSVDFSSAECTLRTSCRIRITMAYSDVVASSNSYQVMCNRLDLQIASASGYVFKPILPDYTTAGTVQTVYINAAESNMNYTATVTASFLYSSQSFAMVITGDVSNFSNEPDPSKVWKIFFGAMVFVFVVRFTLHIFYCCSAKAKSCLARQKAESRYSQQSMIDSSYNSNVSPYTPFQSGLIYETKTRSIISILDNNQTVAYEIPSAQPYVEAADAMDSVGRQQRRSDINIEMSRPGVSSLESVTSINGHRSDRTIGANIDSAKNRQ